MKLSFVWWNTSLSPVSHPNRSSAEEQKVAVELIELLASQLDVDVICLGEVSEQDIDTMRPKWESLGYSIREGVSSVGRTSFDTCVLYKTDRLFLVYDENLSSIKGASVIKIGQRVDFKVRSDGTLIHLFVSHWPSRLWCSENHADRHLLGVRLRDEIEKVGICSEIKHVIVLGDFNDEPFDQSISEQLMATRDRGLAARKPYLLYNPFWRHMCAVQPYRFGSSGHIRSGSYYYKGDKKNKWRTFDQIIFSSSFLGATDWHLREEMVSVIDHVGYTELVLGAEMRFDHLPVIGVIEKVILNG